MNRLVVKAAKIFAEASVESDKYLLIENDKFSGFITENELKKIKQENTIIKNYTDSYILPGLIDTHIHGAVGYDTMDASGEALTQIAVYLLTQGTTGWLPTTVTAPLPDIYRAIANVKKVSADLSQSSARILGMFIEGPYITAQHKGAHPESCIRDLNRIEIKTMLEAGPVKAIIIAPEKKLAPEFTQWLTQKLSVKVSLGHSSADYAEACACFDLGADGAVHTFCGMEQLHHRSPNLLGAALTRDDVYAELIADGIHVSNPAIQILLRCKPKDKVILISDAIRAAGLKDGRYMLGILPFNVKNGIARIDSGNIAGSTTTLLKEVRHLIVNLQVNPTDAVNMASLNPAKRYHLDNSIGSIKAGKRADFIVVDKDFQIRETWLDGKLAYAKTKIK